MKKGLIFLSLLLSINVTACRPQQKIIENLQKVEAMEAFEEYTGFRVEEGRFYFTAFDEDENFNVYSIDLRTKKMKEVFTQIHQYDSFIPLAKRGAVYVDPQGNLFHKDDDKEVKIDEGVTGFNSPNVVVSPNRSGVIYTKGVNEKSSLYRYMFGEKKPQLIVANISEEAYKDFPFTTLWSSNSNYFVYNNSEVYNDKGEKVASIKATSVKWSPDDEYIAYIQMPENKQDKEIAIGDWNTFIGDKFLLRSISTGDEKVILEKAKGILDPIDAIQWSWNSKNVAILEGEIILGESNYLERMEYEGVQVYHIPTEKIHKVEEMTFNFYQMLFTDFIYAKGLGKRSPLEILPITEGKKRVYEEPLVLNNRDMFIISGEEKGYLINGRELVELDAKGDERILITLPWDAHSMFLDEVSQTLVIINRQQEMYVYSLEGR